MHLYRRIAPLLSLFFCIPYLTSSQPTHSGHLNVPNVRDGTPIIVPRAPDDHRMIQISQEISAKNFTREPDLSSIPFTNRLQFWVVKWIISDTLHLQMNVGAWVLGPEKIVQTLVTAQERIGKKVATALLERKFKSETGSRMNTMIFEISPGWTDPKKLTWGDVGEVLGENGLPRFFEERQEWHSVYFDVHDSVRGMIGEGAVRKWYM